MKKIEVLFFGQLTDITGTSAVIVEGDMLDLEALKENLFLKFPVLKDSKFALALDNELIFDNIELPNNCTLAFMPPFSGG